MIGFLFFSFLIIVTSLAISYYWKRTLDKVDLLFSLICVIVTLLFASLF